MGTVVMMIVAGVVSVLSIVYTIGVIVDDCREKRRRDLGYPEDEELPEASADGE